MPRALPAAALAALLLAGCGPSRTEIADAMIHRCEMERLAAEMAAEPDRADLRDAYVERGTYLQTVVETSGDPARLREILAERTCD